MRARMRPMTSPARLPSLMMASRDCRTSCRAGGWPPSQRKAAWALVTAAAIGAAVSHDLKKGFVRLNNAAFKIPDRDPDDIGIDQPPDLRLTLLQIAVETRVLQRDRRLRREQLEDRDSIRGERVRGQRVFE